MPFCTCLITVDDAINSGPDFNMQCSRFTCRNKLFQTVLAKFLITVLKTELLRTFVKLILISKNK